MNLLNLEGYRRLPVKVLLVAVPVVAAGCQSNPNALAGDSSAAADLIIAGVMEKNPDRQELCRKGVDHIRFEVTNVATKLYMAGQIRGQAQIGGRAATERIYKDCQRQG